MLENLLGFDDLQNFWGPLGPDVRKRLLAVVKKPTQATWSHAYSIILRNGPGFGLTLWQAWISVDPTAPKVGPAYTSGMKMGQWSRIPTQEEIFWMIRYAATAEGKAVSQ